MHNNGKKNRGRFDARRDEGIFIGFCSANKAHRVYNKCIKVIEESIHFFYKTHNNHSRTFSFDEFQLTKYTNDEDERAQDKRNN